MGRKYGIILRDCFKKMKLEIFDYLSTTPSSFMRRCGYSEYIDHRTKKVSYSRRLGSGFFPKFHVYVMQRDPKGWILDLHIDHKQHTYGENTAHSGEYSGPLIETEMKRIYTILQTI